MEPQVDLWQSDAWQAQWGNDVVEGYHACYTEPASARCQSHRARSLIGHVRPAHEYQVRHEAWKVSAVGGARPAQSRGQWGMLGIMLGLAVRM